MSGFWSVSLFWILLLVCVGVALAFVLPPLLRRNVKSNAVDRTAVNVAIYRDQLAELDADLKNGELTEDQYQAARLEIEKRAAEDVPRAAQTAQAVEGGRWAGFAVGGAFPVLALVLYALLGSPDALSVAPAQAAPAHGAAGGAQGEHDPSAMIATLEAKLKEKPDDSAGWYMLGRTYGALGRYEDAAKALAKTNELLPNDARVMADYAEALALAQGRRIDGKPLELLTKALEINDKEEKALELLGIAAYQKKNFAQAAFYWRQLLKVIPKDTDYARDIAAAAEEAEKAAADQSGLGDKARLGAQADAAEKAKEKAKRAHQGSGPSVSGSVTIKGDLIAKVKSADTVFIFAQAPGAKMPLASVKITPDMLPYQFTLDDSQAMSPDHKLSAQSEVVIVARISKSGQPTAQSGDLQGKSAPVKVGQHDVKIVIDSVLP